MRPLLAFCLSGFMLLSATPPVSSQTVRETCEALAAPMAYAAESMRTLADSAAGMDEAGAISALEGAERRAFERMRDARLEMMPELEDYVAKLEAAAAMMEACSR